MKFLVFILIIGLISIMPHGLWISIGIFFVWLLYKLKNLKGIQIEIVNQSKQKEYDSAILQEMK